MITKIINSALILFAVFMGLKQGYAMLTGKAEMLDMFGKWQYGKLSVAIYGTVTVLSALLILFPKTFLWGNFLMAATILLIICFHLQLRDLKAATIELPFIVINMVIIYLQYPFTKAT